MGVSGGSYIAAAIALADHAAGGTGGETGRRGNQSGGEHAAPQSPAGLAPGGRPFAPGSAEEQRLRNNTHYLAPDGKTFTAGLLTLLGGAFVISLILIAPVFVVAHAFGWLLRYTHVLTWRAGQAVPLAEVTSWWWWLWPAAAAVVCAGVFVIWHRRGDRGQRLMLTRALGWVTAVAAGLTVATMVVPLTARWLAEMVTWTGPSASGSALTLSLLTLVSTLGGLAKSGSGQVQRWGKQLTNMPHVATSLLGRIGAWAQRSLLPWLAVALIVIVTVIVGLLWVQDGSRYGLVPAETIPVVVAAAVVMAGRFIDVNRLSMHDFYQWRLAAGYAGQGHQKTRLSELRHGGTARKLTIATTANINASGQTAGQGAACLTFTPDTVRLWHGPGTASQAAMSDMELMAGPDHMTLFDIVALSGAAISPLMGRATRAAFRLPLTVANVRLGQWLPSPDIVAQARKHLHEAAHQEKSELTPLRHLWWLLLWYSAAHPRWTKTRHEHRTGDESPASKGEEHAAFLWASLLHLRSEAARLGAEIAAGGASSPGAAAKRRELRRRNLQAHLLYRWLQPSLGLLWAETLGHCSYRQTWMYVTDGGHYDNLGLVAALRNDNDRNDRIVVLDASGDRPDRWSTIGGAIALARTDAGFTIDLDPSDMRPATGQGPQQLALTAGEVRQPWVQGPFNGRGGRSGQLWVCKLGWWHDASWDIRAYATAHPSYPCHSTAQQLYDAGEFEAYRALGYQAVEAAAGHGHLDLQPPRPHAPWTRLEHGMRDLSSAIARRAGSIF